MNQKQTGTIIIIAALFVAAIVLFLKLREDFYINSIIHETGSCYLSDGTCLHEDRNIIIYIVGWALSLGILLFGIYLAFFDRTQKILAEHQVKISSALESAQKHEQERDEFGAFLAGFSEDEQKVIKAVKEQDGITQSTLRFRSGLSKAMLSLILKSLEEKGFVKRNDYKKTKQVFLVKKF